MSGDASQDPEISKPEDAQSIAPVSGSVFSDERDLSDELPEEEPLTPEMVEEEAVRGDFMLRWAVVFLAILMACTQINDTKPLVLIRSGDYMRAHGLLPPRTDALSLTAAGKPAPNVSWLFDHLVSLCWSAGGEKALTLLKVAIAGLLGYLITHISIRGVPTWWNSICAMFAIVACSSDFVPLPELVTMLGMTITMRWLYQHRMGLASGLLWKMPLLIAVWCNLDPRAWVGAFVVVLYLVGTIVENRIAANKSKSHPETGGKPLVLIGVLSLLALLINPFPLNSLLGPMTVYSVVYPAMQAQRRVDIDSAALNFDGRVDYYSVLNPSAMRLFDHSQIAGLALLLVGFVVLLLARTRRDLGFLFALMGVTLLTLLAAHELPAAAIVACVVASVSAQDWYRRTFSQQYTVESGELLFSRGGRALTVLAMAGLGFCVVASRLPGAAPLGWGFDSDTRITMDSFASQIKNLDPDASILHTRLEQGDLLIWNGRKSFIDSRTLPFGRPGDPKSVFGKHSNILHTLFQPTPPPQDVGLDKAKVKQYEEQMQANLVASDAALKEFGVTHAMTRLAPPGPPDYRSMLNLAQSQQWIPVSIEASAAILERVSPSLPVEERAKLAPNWTKMAFRDAASAPSTRREFAREPNFYERYVYRVRPSTDVNLRLAMHQTMLGGMELGSVEQALSAIANQHLAIRSLNESLYADPNDARAYRLLGSAYARLGELEEMVGGQQLGDRIKRIRYFEAVMAYRQSLVVEPDSEAAWSELLRLYRRRNRIDLADEALDHLLPILEEKFMDSDIPEIQAFLSEQRILRREYSDMVRENDERLAKFRDEQAKLREKEVVPETEEERVNQLVELVIQLDSQGFALKALELLDAEQEAISHNPRAVVRRGQLMLETGRVEDAYQTLAMMAEPARKDPQMMMGTEWQFPTAISQLAIADLTSAYDTWSLQLKDLDTLMTMQDPYVGSLFSLPLVADANSFVNAPIPAWPLQHLEALKLGMEILPASRAEIQFLMAMIRLEEANLESARTLLKSVIAEGGDSSYRGLAITYFVMLDEEAQVFLNDHAFDAWDPYDFPGEPISESPATNPLAPQKR